MEACSKDQAQTLCYRPIKKGSPSGALICLFRPCRLRLRLRKGVVLFILVVVGEQLPITLEGGQLSLQFSHQRDIDDFAKILACIFDAGDVIGDFPRKILHLLPFFDDTSNGIQQMSEGDKTIDIGLHRQGQAVPQLGIGDFDVFVGISQTCDRLVNDSTSPCLPALSSRAGWPNSS